MLLQELLQLYEDKGAFLASKHDAALRAAADADHSYSGKDDSAEIVAHLAVAEPVKGKYLQFLVNMYIKKQFKIEDLGRLKGDLAQFEKFKLKIANKDISSYKSLNDLYDAIEPFEAKEVELSGKKKDKMVKNAGVKKLIDTPHFKVIIPKTEEASKFYGKGTKWCTAAEADKKCLFSLYNAIGELYIIIATIDGKERKFQYHAQDEQFMNERDTAVSKADIAALSKIPEYTEFVNYLIDNHYGGLNMHAEPHKLKNYDAFETVPKLVWQKYKGDKAELKKREAIFAKDAEYAYRYAYFVLNGPFRAGEAAIAKDPELAVNYAINILKGPFKAGEAAIAKDPEGAEYYQEFLERIS